MYAVHLCRSGGLRCCEVSVLPGRQCVPALLQSVRSGLPVQREEQMDQGGPPEQGRQHAGGPLRLPVRPEERRLDLGAAEQGGPSPHQSRSGPGHLLRNRGRQLRGDQQSGAEPGPRRRPRGVQGVRPGGHQPQGAAAGRQQRGRPPAPWPPEQGHRQQEELPVLARQRQGRRSHDPVQLLQEVGSGGRVQHQQRVVLLEQEDLGPQRVL